MNERADDMSDRYVGIPEYHPRYAVSVVMREIVVTAGCIVCPMESDDHFCPFRELVGVDHRTQCQDTFLDPFSNFVLDNVTVGKYDQLA